MPGYREVRERLFVTADTSRAFRLWGARHELDAGCPQSMEWPLGILSSPAILVQPVVYRAIPEAE